MLFLARLFLFVCFYLSTFICLAQGGAVSCNSSGNWLLFANYDGGRLSIIVDQNIPNLKIGISTYEPVIVTFSGAFVGNITDVYYAGFNSFQNNNNCGFPISTSSFVGINPSLITVDVVPPVNIISAPNPNNILNTPNGNNTGVVCLYSCDVNSSQGGCNTIDQVVDVFQTRFGGSLRGLEVQYCCWNDNTPYRVSGVTGNCCNNNNSGIATIDYPSGPFCLGQGQIIPTLLGDSSGTFNSSPAGLSLNPSNGIIDLANSAQGTYEVEYAIAANCIAYLYKDTIVISASITNFDTISACGSYIAPWGTAYTQSGIYSDTIITLGGCDSIIIINLTINNNITLPPIIVNTCDSFISPWGTVYTQSGIYSDTIITSGVCDSIISINSTINNGITLPPLTVNACDSFISSWGTVYTQSGIYSDTIITSGVCDSIISINLTISNSISNPPFIVNACDSFISSWGIIYNQSGIYSDTLSSATGCDSITTIILSITQDSLPEIISADSDTCSKSNISFFLTNNETITSVNWNFGDPSSGTNNTSTSFTPLHLFEENGTYNIRSIINTQCSIDTLFKTLSIVNCDSIIENCEIFLPNIFTPNNDGVNDSFYPLTICNYEFYEFQIFNRWGELIYKTSNKLDRWNGTYKAKECSSGVYVYSITYKFLLQQTKNINGTITLLR